MKFLIWGCGERCNTFIERGYIDPADISGVIDSRIKSDFWHGIKVFGLQDIKELSDDDEYYIVVTTKKYDVCAEINETIKKMQIPAEKICFIYNRHRIAENIQISNQKYEIIKEHFPVLYRKEVLEREEGISRKVDIIRCGFDQVDADMLIETELFSDAAYLNEYIRYRTFELVANEIEQNGLSGAVAEVGVYKGTFSRLINGKFPERKLYLFDSFESFKKDEYEKEIEEGNCKEGFFNEFLDTSEKEVIQKMPHPENCIVRRGYFPESLKAEDLKEQFVFISIDVDFEESTYLCLKYLYPLVVRDGYIFLHDYNNRFLGGVKNAVRRYESETGKRLKKVPICDEGGTLILVKEEMGICQ